MATETTLDRKVEGAAQNDSPDPRSVTSADITFLQKHTRGVIKVLKPRLASNAEKYVKSAPLNTVAPTISPTGSQVSGTVLTTTNGTWLFSPSITYKWLRNGNVIPGATTVTYTTVTADKTFQIQSQVNASNSNGANAEPSSNSVSVT